MTNNRRCEKQERKNESESVTTRRNDLIRKVMRFPSSTHGFMDEDNKRQAAAS
ncbi:MAG: hypothetical protein LBE78_06390 [Burkholderiaceae bacterium]|jgi:hypothetical protein|nr:hypothetical protein [Burkholderiaceae bacterium]